MLINLINDLSPPLPDRQSVDSADKTVSPRTDPTQPTRESSNEQPMSLSVRDDQHMSECVRDATTNQPMSDLVSVCQPVSISTDDGVRTQNECCFFGVRGEELTQVALLKLMLGSLPPLVVNKLLSGCRGNAFGGKTPEQLHSLLSKLTSFNTQQRLMVVLATIMSSC